MNCLGLVEQLKAAKKRRADLLDKTRKHEADVKKYRELSRDLEKAKARLEKRLSECEESNSTLKDEKSQAESQLASLRVKHEQELDENYSLSLELQSYMNKPSATRVERSVPTATQQSSSSTSPNNTKTNPKKRRKNEAETLIEEITGQKWSTS